MGFDRRVLELVGLFLIYHTAGKAHPRRLSQVNALRGRWLASTRETWNGCKCKASWNMPEEGSCNQTCCALGDPDGDWCMVQDPSCEDAEWGYCRPDDATIGACTDEPLNWRDSEGDSCAKYAALKWCTPDGGYGSHWDEDDFGDFSAFAGVGGLTAAEACCSCGGGSDVAKHCADDKSWQDKDGDSCDVYAEFAWCNSTGQPGVGWHAEKWGTIASFADKNGKSALQACCACGGGSRVVAPHNESDLQRYTFSGCACKKVWDGCSTSCCTADGDPMPWCEVMDEDCEDSDWGYCRDEDWTPPREGACANSPAGWHDKAYYNCLDYDELDFCTTNGALGEGWVKEDWGTLKDWAPIEGIGKGLSAADVCCVCGGGEKQAAPSYYSGCADVDVWEDEDGDTCEDYAFSQYCTTDGKPGKGWNEEWGGLAAFASNGRSAIQACCVCGGGVRGGHDAPTQAPGAAAAAQPSGEPADVHMRYTMVGCRCKTSWTMDDLPSCSHSCCNPDDDDFGLWCMVEDEDCEEADWGYCRSEQDPDAFKTCQNSPPNWVDSEGDSCLTYVAEGWCTTQGREGPSWESGDWGKVEDFAKDGKDAFTACCECGGGEDRGTAVAGCRDLDDWADDDGDACMEYEDYGWCTASGDYGAGWHEEWGKFTGSPIASEACCACGGGRHDVSFVQAHPSSQGESHVSAALPADTGGAGGAMIILVVVLIIAGAGMGWYCYSSKVAGNTDAEGLGAGRTFGKKYATMEEGE
mmetsp:Transcript_15805/g.45048  ORF Transcript_15805/g.45048 Transcript_15805/m.45048 type:complete len:751 (-) Transcript_15805:83-2335(-)|eukprot:CAMPEP_0170276620 /NCGR_PEP_ID=MMETSP0116_2-20130129/38294_1 /TAXON_ID=400756 /ORGANISM="Durinskia baltica, Strain CSIRO CS-38" /LENGTH=750 /DNA_ID=CAMNT_0010527891 /DNA_START=94 /DNA_END=2346 /DNA_ORIENTATION=-